MKNLLTEYGGVMVFLIIYSFVIPYFYTLLSNAALGKLIQKEGIDMSELFENYGDVLISIICVAIILILTDPVLNMVGGFVDTILIMLMG